MYYVPDGTEMCGFYECEECANRFLSLKIGPKLVCPYCGEEPDMEIGPDEEMPVAKETAKLLEVVEEVGAFEFNEERRRKQIVLENRKIYNRQIQIRY